MPNTEEVFGSHRLRLHLNDAFYALERIADGMMVAAVTMPPTIAPIWHHDPGECRQPTGNTARFQGVYAQIGGHSRYQNHDAGQPDHGGGFLPGPGKQIGVTTEKQSSKKGTLPGSPLSTQRAATIGQSPILV